MKKVFIGSRHSGRDSRQGSALITSVIFSFLVMSLMGSYLYLSSGEYRISTRAFLSNASFNLAEGGLDLGLDAIQQKNASGWITGKDANGNNYWARAFKKYDLGGNITGEVKVVILNPGSLNPEIYTEGLAQGHIAGDVKKQLYANLTGGFVPFINGFNTKKGIVFKGNNVTFDSYDSRNGAYNVLTNRNSEITIATISVEVDAIDIGNADVYGYVATGQQMPDVGPKGSITKYGSSKRIDRSRITTDFYMDFPNVSAPALSSPKTFLPTNGVVSGGEYLINNWSSSGGDTLYITGDTTIVATGDMSMTGKARIIIDPAATVKIYGAGDMDIGGNGILNASYKPEQLLVFGTDTKEGDKDIKIAGNGFLSSAVYAPNANVELKGGGTNGRVYGAVVAYDADLVGHSHFSYDEALGDYNLGEGGYVIDEWVELAGVSLTSMQLDMGKYGL